MTLSLIPEDILHLYDVFEWKHAASILYCDYPTEFNEIISVLRNFQLTRTSILTKGGGNLPSQKHLIHNFTTYLGKKNNSMYILILIILLSISLLTK